MTNKIAQSTHCIPRSVHASDRSVCALQIQVPPSQAAEGLKILGLSALHYVIRKPGRGRLLVPMDRFKIVAHELFVKGRLRAARLPRRGLPETRGVRRQHLIGQDDAFRRSAKLKFRVGQDQAARFGMRGGLVVDGQRQALEFCRVGLADGRDGGRIGDVLVVRAGLALGRGSKERLRQPRAVLQAGGQRNTADRYCSLCIPSIPNPSGSRAPRTRRGTSAARFTSIDRPSS